MAISPRDAAKRQDHNHEEELAEAEKRLDRVLASCYRSGCTVHIDSKNLPGDYHVRDALFARYRKAGWKIEHHSDQREQTDYYTFGSRGS